MQYRSGNNPHEPLFDDRRSRTWKFILRGAYSPRLPEAFVPHVNLCSWISQPQGQSSSFLLRGVIQTINPRNYHTLKTRYSKEAEWIPVGSDQRQVEEFTRDPMPSRARRYIFRTESTTPLHKVGYNIQVPDLCEDYLSALYAAEVLANPGIDESAAASAPDEGYESPTLDDDDYSSTDEAPQDFTYRDRRTGRVLGGVQGGYYFTAEPQGLNKRRRFD